MQANMLNKNKIQNLKIDGLENGDDRNIFYQMSKNILLISNNVKSIITYFFYVFEISHQRNPHQKKKSKAQKQGEFSDQISMLPTVL